MPAPAARSRLFGYEHRANGTVVITRACRIVSVIRGDARVLAFLDDLAAEDAQTVLARWVTHTARAAV
ncbi:hypothetical protein [Streptomyces sp. NPDC008121]|uniref:hypothetical protein n=1 Tax=Streptomyces sp. NPDC008121 TaxID=3364809 RepID=UPI0036E674A2